MFCCSNFSSQPTTTPSRAIEFNVCSCCIYVVTCVWRWRLSLWACVVARDILLVVYIQLLSEIIKSWLQFWCQMTWHVQCRNYNLTSSLFSSWAEKIKRNLNTKHSRQKIIINYIFYIYFFRCKMTGNIPESIKCKLCGEVCKRGVSLGCCDTIACRSCATKSITTTR